ncbi:MAG: energy-coupled thiamine transporter ThiT [Cellulosilyticaceae bacterium]
MKEVFSKFTEVRFPVWIVVGLLFVVCITSIIFLRKKKSTTSNMVNTKKIVYGGLCIALAFVLSYIRLWHMPQGGSITLASMLPLVLFAFIFGPMAGIVAGISYGFLQLFQDISVVHWAQLLLDYPLAFAMLGLAGIVPKKVPSLQIRFGLGIFIGMLGRTIMHTLSGAIFFAEYANGLNPWVYSLGYNISYMSVEFIITLILGLTIASTPIYKTFKNSVQC